MNKHNDNSSVSPNAKMTWNMDFAYPIYLTFSGQWAYKRVYSVCDMDSNEWLPSVENIYDHKSRQVVELVMEIFVWVIVILWNLSQSS
jgi:hypothetical protein